MKSGILEQLLQGYGTSPAVRCVEFNALVGLKPGEDSFDGDEEGHLISWGESSGSMSAVSPVRVMIRSGATKQEALTLLKKIIETVEECYEDEPADVGHSLPGIDRRHGGNVIEFPKRYAAGESRRE